MLVFYQINCLLQIMRHDLDQWYQDQFQQLILDQQQFPSLLCHGQADLDFCWSNFASMPIKCFIMTARCCLSCTPCKPFLLLLNQVEPTKQAKWMAYWLQLDLAFSYYVFFCFNYRKIHKVLLLPFSFLSFRRDYSDKSILS